MKPTAELELTSGFINLLASLPMEPWSNHSDPTYLDSYQDVFEQWGTHYVSKAYIGGLYEHTIIASQCAAEASMEQGGSLEKCNRFKLSAGVESVPYAGSLNSGGGSGDSEACKGLTEDNTEASEWKDGKVVESRRWLGGGRDVLGEDVHALNIKEWYDKVAQYPHSWPAKVVSLPSLVLGIRNHFEDDECLPCRKLSDKGMTKDDVTRLWSNLDQVVGVASSPPASSLRLPHTQKLVRGRSIRLDGRVSVRSASGYPKEGVRLAETIPTAYCGCLPLFVFCIHAPGFHCVLQGRAGSQTPGRAGVHPHMRSVQKRRRRVVPLPRADACLLSGSQVCWRHSTSAIAPRPPACGNRGGRCLSALVTRGQAQPRTAPTQDAAGLLLRVSPPVPCAPNGAVVLCRSVHVRICLRAFVFSASGGVLHHTPKLEGGADGF